MDGKRSALIVASGDYTGPGLKRLRAPVSDARALAAVLQAPAIGDFEVRTLLNEPAHEVNLAVEEFFADRRPDDLLLLHIACHGVKDESGELYFAMANTLLRRMGATAVAAGFVRRCMNRSRSRRIVLLLDCCYAGAFERGMTARAGAGMEIESRFGGQGRAVITASSAMEYAFETDQPTDTHEPVPSVFTSALVEGLETGEADRDQDGLVALDELYSYIYDKVREATPNQTPGKWTFGVQGELVIARRARPVSTPAPLPTELREAIDSPLAAVRAAAVQELARLLHGTHAGQALAAQLALERLIADDSRTVAAAAVALRGPRMAPTAAPRLGQSVTAAPAPPEPSAPARPEPPLPGRPQPGPLQDQGRSVPAATPPGQAPARGQTPASTPAALADEPGPAAQPTLRRAWMAVAVAAVLAAAGAGGSVVLGQADHPGRGSHPGRDPRAASSSAVSPPPCTTRAAKAKALPGVRIHQVNVGGKPFDAVVSDGFGFVSLGTGLAVMNTTRPVPRLVTTIPLSAAEGEALTPNRKYLLVSGGSGITVFRVSDLERGSSTPLGQLTSPGGKYAVEVTPSPDGKFAFVTLQNSGQVAVFSLQRALAKGFGRSDLVRTISVGAEPIGIASSADGRYLYVTQGLAGPAAASGRGSLVVLSMAKAEQKSADSLVHAVDAGCGPARVVPSANGKTVWVTAGGGNALLAYSATKLISDPTHALIARVAVGQIPLGLVIVGNGTRIVLADSNRDGIPNSVPNLAVVDVAKALAGEPALIGVIRSGMTPRQFALEPNGTTLLVTNTDSHQVQAVDIGHLP